MTISPVKKTLLCSSKAQRIISLSQLGFRRSSWIVGLGQKPGWYPSQKCVSRGVQSDLLDACLDSDLFDNSGLLDITRF